MTDTGGVVGREVGERKKDQSQFYLTLTGIVKSQKGQHIACTTHNDDLQVLPCFLHKCDGVTWLSETSLHSYSNVTGILYFAITFFFSFFFFF